MHEAERSVRGARARFVGFCVVALSLALLAVVVAPPGSDGVQLLTMATPALSTLVMMLVVTSEGWHRAGWSRLGLGRLGLRGWPAALGIPIVVILGSAMAAALVVDVTWDLQASLFVSVPVGVVTVSALAFFEELGWRGYLLPLLPPGDRSAALVGFVHGLWHLPLVLFTTAYLPDGNRAVTIPVFLALLTTAGVVYGRLRALTGSLWPVIIAHGTFNTLLGAMATVSTGHGEAAHPYLTGESGILTLAFAMASVMLVRPWPRRGARSAPTAPKVTSA